MRESAQTFEDAVILAAQAHRHQRDKAGEPYILHVLRVMLRQDDPTARIVAVLHDVLEDTTLTLDDLRRADTATTCARLSSASRNVRQNATRQ